MNEKKSDFQYMIMFPCYTLASQSGQGVVIQPMDDGHIAIVLLTDEDLLQRYREANNLQGATITFNNAFELLAFCDDLPQNVTHVTIDPKSTLGWCPSLADIMQQLMRQYGIK